MTGKWQVKEEKETYKMISFRKDCKDGGGCSTQAREANWPQKLGFHMFP